MANKNSHLKKTFVFLSGALIGALIFILIYGIYVLNPTYDDWILARDGDNIQHYLGWIYFRRSPWHFPLCLTDGLLSTGPVSCMYTDSIPILAVFFKLLSPILPETFQYMGLWALICYILNGGFSAILMYKIKPNIAFSAACSVLFIMYPPTSDRIFGHDSLIAIWLILAAFVLLLNSKTQWKNRFTPVILWSVLCAISVTIHMYFLPMIYIVMLGWIVIEIFRNKNKKRAILTFFNSVALTLLVLWLIGAFYGNGGKPDGGFGLYSANLNTFFNSKGFSTLIPPLPIREGQYEGYGYLGAGVLLCGIISIIYGIIHIAVQEGKFAVNLIKWLKIHKIEVYSFLTVFLVSFIFAVSHIVAFNDVELFTLDFIPKIFISICNIFRASGRFVWVSGLLLTTLFLGIISKMKGRFIAVILVIAVSLQFTDLSKRITSLNNKYNKTITYETWVSSKKWDKYTEGASEIIFLKMPRNHIAYTKHYYSFALLAIEKNMTMSSFVISRFDFNELWKYSETEYENLINGRGKKNALYVFYNEEDYILASENCGNDVEFCEIDGYYIAKRIE
ncbi:MAG: hypothetical protein IKJ60_10010 [Ruminococcus sp.]|nr:hypothetical protein [Ruminococcus sp.]